MSTLFHLSEATRELPQSPVVFGVVSFAILGFLLYLVLRLDR
ncbi:MAG: hypothetical protein ACKO8C_00235 [Candidatus Nanopelagicaceae bacterium]